MLPMAVARASSDNRPQHLSPGRGFSPHWQCTRCKRDHSIASDFM